MVNPVATREDVGVQGTTAATDSDSNTITVV